MHGLHLETQVSLGDKTLGALIDLLNHVGVNLNAKVLSSLKLLVQDSDALADRLVVFHVCNALNEVPNVKLLLKFEM